MSTTQADLGTCNGDLIEADETIKERDSTIVILNGEKDQLQVEIGQLDTEISVLRCDVNRFLSTIQTTQSNAVKFIDNLRGIYDQADKDLGTFVDATDLDCPTCGTDGPCVTDKAAEIEFSAVA